MGISCSRLSFIGLPLSANYELSEHQNNVSGVISVTDPDEPVFEYLAPHVYLLNFFSFKFAGVDVSVPKA